MKKKHVNPEFTIVKSDEANQKFFVASEQPGPVEASLPDMDKSDGEW